MSDGIVVKVDATRAILKLGRVPEATRAAVRGEVVSLTQALAQLVREKLSGGVLNVQSGRLLNSIRSQMIENPTSVYGKVSTQGVPYAAIHEYGGVTRPHDIRPVNAGALWWEGAAHPVKLVHHPGSKIPERSYMRSSLAEMQDDIVARLTAAAREGAGKA